MKLGIFELIEKNFQYDNKWYQNELMMSKFFWLSCFSNNFKII